MQRALRALVSLGGLAMGLYVFSEATITKVVHVFRLALINLVIIDCVEETLLRQLSLIIPRAITITAQARSHLLLSGIRVNDNKAFLLTLVLYSGDIFL